MSVITKCTTCGRELRAKDEYAGYRTRCPDCGTINVLPDQPGRAGQDGEPAVGEAPEGECPLCGQDFYANRDWVKDTKGRYFHRCCYEAAQLRQKNRKHATEPTQGTPLSQTKGQLRRPASSRSEPKWTTSSLLGPPTPPPNLPNRLAAPTPPPNAAGLAGVSAPSRSRPNPAATPSATNTPPANDDFWGELGAPLESNDTLWSHELLADGETISGPDGPGLAAGTVLAPVSTRSKLDRHIKMLIGAGAAVPVLLVIAIVISILIRPDPPTRSVADSNPIIEQAAPNPETEQATIPLTPSPTLPPAYQDRFRSAKPSQSPLPGAKDASAFVPGIGVFVGILAVYLLVVTATLQTACGLCHVPSPSFGKAVFVSIAAVAVASLLNTICSVLPKEDPGQAAFAFVITLVSVVTGVGFIYSKLLPTTFGKGALIYLAQIIILVAIVFVIGLIVLVLAFLFGIVVAMMAS